MRDTAVRKHGPGVALKSISVFDIADSSMEDSSDTCLVRLYSKTGKRHLFLIHPTGSGKTRKAAIYFLFLVRYKYIKRVLCVVQKEFYRRQMYEEFADVFRMFYSDDEIDRILRVVKCYELVKSKYYTNDTEDGCGIFLDEAHNLIPRAELAKTKKRKKKDDSSAATADGQRDNQVILKEQRFQMIRRISRKCFVVFATATPFFSNVLGEANNYRLLCTDDDNVHITKREIVEFFHDRMCFPDKRVYDQYPCRLKFVWRKNLNHEELRQDPASDESFYFPCYKILSDECKTDVIVQKIVASAPRSRHFVLAYLLKDFHAMCAKLKSKNVRFIKLESKMKNRQFEETLSAFNSTDNDAVNVLVATSVFGEGHNLRNIDKVHIINPCYTYVSTPTIQWYGRAIRFRSHSVFTTVDVYLYCKIDISTHECLEQGENCTFRSNRILDEKCVTRDLPSSSSSSSAAVAAANNIRKHSSSSRTMYDDNSDIDDEYDYDDDYDDEYDDDGDGENADDPITSIEHYYNELYSRVSFVQKKNDCYRFLLAETKERHIRELTKKIRELYNERVKSAGRSSYDRHCDMFIGEIETRSSQCGLVDRRSDRDEIYIDRDDLQLTIPDAVLEACREGDGGDGTRYGGGCLRRKRKISQVDRCISNCKGLISFVDENNPEKCLDRCVLRRRRREVTRQSADCATSESSQCVVVNGTLISFSNSILDNTHRSSLYCCFDRRIMQERQYEIFHYLKNTLTSYIIANVAVPKDLRFVSSSGIGLRYHVANKRCLGALDTLSENDVSKRRKTLSSELVIGYNIFNAPMTELRTLCANIHEQVPAATMNSDCVCRSTWKGDKLQTVEFLKTLSQTMCRFVMLGN